METTNNKGFETLADKKNVAKSLIDEHECFFVIAWDNGPDLEREVKKLYIKLHGNRFTLGEALAEMAIQIVPFRDSMSMANAILETAGIDLLNDKKPKR